MRYVLGVDVGTTYTAAAVARGERVEIAGLGDRAPVIPTTVYLRDDGQLLLGEPAEYRGLQDPTRLAREFKRRIGDPTPILLGGVPMPAHLLLARVLRWVTDHVADREGAYPDAIALTHPANWGAYKLDLLRQAVDHAGFGGYPITYVTEPVAAAIHYSSHQRVEPDEVLAVYDLGGGTFDAAVLRRTPERFEILGQPEGIEHLGGIDIDTATMAHIDRALGGAVTNLDADDPHHRAAAARLHHDAVRAKELLSTDTDVDIAVELPHLETVVRLTRAELESLIRPILEETISAVQRTLASAGVAAADLTAVLLVGGSSRVPMVAQLVGAALRRPVAVDAHPKHTVAMGAAIAGALGTAAGAVERADAVESREAPAPAVLRAWPAPPSEAAEAHTQAVASLPPPPVPGAAPPVPAARPPRRPGRLAAAGLVALALIGGVVAWRAVADDGTGSTTTPATAPSTSAPPRSTTTLGDTQIPPDATPGAITSLWRIALPYQGSGTFSGLAADEARVYVAWDEPDLVAALEVGTGATLWEAPLDVDTRFVHAADGNVYVQAYREDDEQGVVVALVADSGVERWRTEHHTGTDGTTPAVAAPGAGLVYVSNVDSIEALDAGTGEVVWSEDVLTQEPAASGDTLVVNFLAELRVLDAATGENRWAVERASDAIGQTPVIVEAAVVTVDDDPATAVVAYDRQSGDELWTEDLGQEIEELVAVGSSVLALTTLDRLFVLDERGDRVFTAPVAPVGQTAWDLIPAAARVFAVAEDDHIVAYNDQGVRLQTIDAQALVTGDPNGGFVGLISAASAVGDGLVFHVGGHADGVIVVRLG